MSKIPIDIVILPPDDIMDICIDLSKKAHERGENKFLRSKTDRLPHISLLMGYLHEENKTKAIKSLKDAIRDLKPIPLSIISQNQKGGLDIEKTKELIDLQNTLIEKINHLFHQDCELTDLLEEKLSENSRLWVNNFIETSTGEKFCPHITTHNRKKEDIKLPIEFLADRIAMCHMGDEGTCRKILSETNLIPST